MLQPQHVLFIISKKVFHTRFLKYANSLKTSFHTTSKTSVDWQQLQTSVKYCNTWIYTYTHTHTQHTHARTAHDTDDCKLTVNYSRMALRLSETAVAQDYRNYICDVVLFWLCLSQSRILNRTTVIDLHLTQTTITIVVQSAHEKLLNTTLTFLCIYKGYAIPKIESEMQN